MILYHVQKGDTIAQVTRELNTDWQTLKKQNPTAIGQSRTSGNWFLREGATVQLTSSFAQSLRDEIQQQETEEREESTTSSLASQVPLMVHPLIEETGDEEETSSSSSPATIEHTVQAGDTIWELAVKKYHVNVEDILTANSISDPRALKVGQILHIPLPPKGEQSEVTASWYGEDFHGRPMANGEIYNMHGATIAHKELPLGTRVQLTNARTGETATATVADRGPYIEGRDVDLSYGLAKKLSLLEQGVGSLEMQIL